jgi:hypothetical protein
MSDIRLSLAGREANARSRGSVSTLDIASKRRHVPLPIREFSGLALLLQDISLTQTNAIAVVLRS